jgi:hypothetical protein
MMLMVSDSLGHTQLIESSPDQSRNETRFPVKLGTGDKSPALGGGRRGRSGAEEATRSVLDEDTTTRLGRSVRSHRLSSTCVPS